MRMMLGPKLWTWYVLGKTPLFIYNITLSCAGNFFPCHMLGNFVLLPPPNVIWKWARSSPNDLALVDEIQNLRSQGLQSYDMLDRLHSSGWPDLSLKQLKKLRHREGVYLRTQLGKVEESYEQVCQSSMAPFLQYFELNCIGADLTRDRG